MGMRQKILENRRRQYLFVQAHKRRIRPHLMAKRQEWWAATSGHKLRIRNEWRTQCRKARAHILDQRRKHRATIISHKLRIQREMGERR